MAKSTKRIMREFRLDEISAVTSPAQKGARMVIMKRDDQPPPTSDAELAAIVKRGGYLMTRPRNGHSHLVEVDDWARLRGGGFTTSVCTPGYAGGRDHYHSHPYVIGPKGEIIIGEMDGHDHEMPDDATAKAAGDPPPDLPATKRKDDEAMTPEELAKLQGDIAKATALAGMTDPQKAHFAKLSGEPAEAFLKADFAGREAEIAKAAAAEKDADPVVFTTKSGIPFRRSAGEAVIALAKLADEQAEKLAKADAKALDIEAETLAKSWGHIGKPYEEKLDLAKKIAALPEAAKAAALAGIEAGRVATAGMFKSTGASGGPGGDASGPLEKLAKLGDEIAKRDGISSASGYSKALETPEGMALYDEIEAAKQAA